MAGPKTFPATCSCCPRWRSEPREPINSRVTLFCRPTHCSNTNRLLQLSRLRSRAAAVRARLEALPCNTLVWYIGNERRSPMVQFDIHIAFDTDAELFVVQDTNVPGLVGEGTTFDDLVR